MQGALAGMVQFVQLHSVNQNANQRQNHPDVVAQRSALLLFPPTSLEDGTLKVEAFKMALHWAR